MSPAVASAGRRLPFSHAPHSHLAGLRVTIAVTASLTFAIHAHALDLGDGGIITETIATRDRLRDYDDAKTYGAQSVTERVRAHVQPEGVRAGNYTIFPSLSETVTFDDNIFRSDRYKQSDIRFETAPSVQFKSALPRHIFDMSLDGKIVNHLEHTDQDYANIRGKLDSALHFDHAHTLSLSVLSMIDHQEPGEFITDKTTIEPVQVANHRVAAGITRDVGRLYGTLMASAERWDFSDARGLGGGKVDQDYRDTDEFAASLRVGYRFSPGFELIARARALVDDNRGDGTFDRDAKGYEALAGLSFETGPLLRWQILGGYGIRDYKSDALDDIATGIMEGRVQWLPTEFLTLTGKVSRHIAAADTYDDDGRVETRISGQVEYEIRNDMVLKFGLAYSTAEFSGVAREDVNLTGRLGLEYYLNKNWMFTMSYEHAVRDSTDPAYDMTRNVVSVGAKLRF